MVIRECVCETKRFQMCMRISLIYYVTYIKLNINYTQSDNKNKGFSCDKSLTAHTATVSGSMLHLSVTKSTFTPKQIHE